MLDELLVGEPAAVAVHQRSTTECRTAGYDRIPPFAAAVCQGLLLSLNLDAVAAKLLARSLLALEAPSHLLSTVASTAGTSVSARLLTVMSAFAAARSHARLQMSISAVTVGANARVGTGLLVGEASTAMSMTASTGAARHHRSEASTTVTMTAAARTPSHHRREASPAATVSAAAAEEGRSSSAAVTVSSATRECGRTAATVRPTAAASVRITSAASAATMTVVAARPSKGRGRDRKGRHACREE